MSDFPLIVSRAAPVFCAGLLFSGCVINDSDDDGMGSITQADTGSGSPTGDPTGSPTGPTVGDSGTGTTTGVTTDGTTGGIIPPGCGDNLIEDPGFEGGSPSAAWMEASDVFGSPICDVDCTEMAGAAPYAGDWWSWHGGIEEEPDVASVSQRLTIDGSSAFLAFRFSINAGAGTGDDIFEVLIDDTSVWMVTDAEVADFANYRLIELDISEYADGGDHTVMFRSDVTGEAITNFFLDEVALVGCEEGGSSSSGSESDSSSDSGSDSSSDSGSDSTGVDETAGSSGGSSSSTTGGAA